MVKPEWMNLELCPPKWCYNGLHMTLECRNTELWPVILAHFWASQMSEGRASRNFFGQTVERQPAQHLCFVWFFVFLFFAFFSFFFLFWLSCPVPSLSLFFFFFFCQPTPPRFVNCVFGHATWCCTAATDGKLLLLLVLHRLVVVVVVAVVELLRLLSFFLSYNFLFRVFWRPSLFIFDCWANCW